MTPEEAREAFSAALDGELDAATRAQFEATLANDVVLAQEYQSFVGFCAALRKPPADAHDAVPDLLPGVQRRLRARSRGRFYRDRFAERVGMRWQPVLALAIVMLVGLALAWVALAIFQGVPR